MGIAERRDVLYSAFKEFVIENTGGDLRFHKWLVQYKNDVHFLYQLHKGILEQKAVIEDKTLNISYEKVLGKWQISFNGDQLMIEEWMLLSYIEKMADMLEILTPIGSVVALRKEYLQKMLEKRTVNEVHLIVQQLFIELPNEDMYIPYGATVHPFGLTFGAKILYFTPPLIESIIHMGLEDEAFYQFEYEMKKELILKKNKHSFAFATTEEQKVFATLIKGGN